MTFWERHAENYMIIIYFLGAMKQLPCRMRLRWAVGGIAIRTNWPGRSIPHRRRWFQSLDGLRGLTERRRRSATRSMSRWSARRLIPGRRAPGRTGRPSTPGAHGRPGTPGCRGTPGAYALRGPARSGSMDRQLPSRGSDLARKPCRRTSGHGKRPANTEITARQSRLCG